MAAPAPGFADPVHDAQRAFRAVLNALARPGTPQPLAGLATAPHALGPEMAAVMLTLADYETPVWLGPALDTEEVRTFATFHTGAAIVEDPAHATFLFVTGEAELPDLAGLQIGEDEYPDRSSTVVLKVGAFSDGRRLEGPGIDGSVSFDAGGLGDRFWAMARENARLFPLGLDFIFVGAQAVAGLPRSTRIGG